MRKLSKKKPIYNWEMNKGYPTKEHKEKIKKFGLSPYHRITFKTN